MESYQEKLFKVPGVVGTGTGAQPGSCEEVIHIYVRSAADLERARSAAEAILRDAPFEVIVMGVPEAQDG